MSRPVPPQPRFFVDRSLGRKAVPDALRADGWDLVTLAEYYGTPTDQEVADTVWIEEAAKQGWPILMKDKRIRHRQGRRILITLDADKMLHIHHLFSSAPIAPLSCHH